MFMNEVNRKAAKKKYNNTGAIMTVIVAPMMAPIIVNISRYIASRRLVILSRTKEAADPLDVAIIATIPHATASLTGIPKSTNIGINMLAPPRPVSEPRKPTRIEMRISVNISSKAPSPSLR